MMPKRDLPASFVSVANKTMGARLSAPSALRNRDDVTAHLTRIAPQKGCALELASGTGEHIICFARQMPDLIWQPTEIDAQRRLSIDAHGGDANLSNLKPAIPLDALSTDWGQNVSPQNLIHLGNLLHLITWAETQTLISQVAQALTNGGVFSLYGPFKRDGQLISEGDRVFHTRLINENPDIGYKNDADIIELLGDAGLFVCSVTEMPASNLAIKAQKPT
jgi:hypothetical protein